MIFRNHEKQYIVIRKPEKSDKDGADQYICRDLENPSKEEYRIIMIPQERVSSSMPYLLETECHTEFTDFVEYFFDGPVLYLVFKEPWSKTLEEKLSSENCSFLEKLTIGREILKHMILLNPPLYYQASAMDIHNIHVAQTGDAAFSYSLEKWYQAEKFNFDDVQMKLSDVMKYLFSKELAAGKFTDMQKYLQQLESGKWENMIEVYREYQAIYERWKDVPDRDMLPETFPEKLARFLDGFKKKIKIAIGALVLVAALGYLGWSIWNAARPDEKMQNFSKIGTLELTTEETETE